MTKRSFTYWLTIFSIFLLAGCRTGCSFTRTLKTSTKKVTINNLPVTIKAIFKKTTHYKRNSPKLFDVSKSGATYFIEMKVEIQDADFSIFFIPAHKKEDLQIYLDKVGLKASANNYYLAAAYEGQVQVVLQKMGDLYHYSPYATPYVEKPLSALNLSALPNEATFLKDVVNHKVEVLSKSITTKADKSFLTYISQQDFNEEDCIALFEQWPNNAITTAYFTPGRIQEIKSKYPKWKTLAKEKSGAFLKGERGFMNKRVSDYIQVFLMLSTPQEVQELDASLASKWGRVFQETATAYFLERVRLQQDSGIPIAKSLIQQIEAKCIKNLKAYTNGIDLDREEKVKDIEKAIEFLLLIKNYQIVQQALPRILDKKKFKESEYKINRIVNNNYALFSETSKKRIMAFYTSIFYSYKKNNQPGEAGSDFNFESSKAGMQLANIYNMLREKVDCEELKKLRAHYKAQFDRTSMVFLKESLNCGF